MSTIKSIREGLAKNLSTITGLRTSYFVPDTINPPVALVEPLQVQYDQTFKRGLDEFTFKVTLIAGRASDRAGQDTIDSFLDSTGSRSIKTAIESDKTLGGKVNDLRVTSLTSYGSITIADVPYLAAEFAVTVYSI